MEINELLSRPADEFGNDESLEEMWAAKAFEHAEIYFNLLCSVDPKLLQLTQIDNTIYTIFREEFPKLDVQLINEDNMKGATGKVKWRLFCDRFKDIIEDYNFGTLMRADCTGEYSENNSMLVPRIQFLAIELARNREGLNDGLRDKYKGQKTTKQEE
ncbi:uncharacterized protein CBL_12760 [Carabus blaptoides fortunei]